jgi:hypothetical protein
LPLRQNKTWSVEYIQEKGVNPTFFTQIKIH